MQINTRYGELTITQHVIDRWHQRFSLNKTALKRTLCAATRPSKKRIAALNAHPQQGRFFLEFGDGVFVVVNQRVVTVWPNQRQQPQLTAIASGLIALFEHQIDTEKQYRSDSDNDQRDYHEGRVDGVDTGRYLVEKFLADNGVQL